MRPLRYAAAAALTAVTMAGAAGCERADRREPDAAPSTAAVTGCPVPTVGTVDAGASLVPGPTNGLAASTARGDTLVVEAVVLDPACRPAAGANVRVWHTDPRGLYGPAGTDVCCYYGGTVRTDTNGRFRLDTVRPAQYPEPGAPPAHIHLEIGHPTGALESEILFDTGHSAPALVRPRRTVPATLRSTGPGSWYAEAAFVLDS
jgi:protocatechuate 3,4-dioxygenase beta subunit